MRVCNTLATMWASPKEKTQKKQKNSATTYTNKAHTVFAFRAWLWRKSIQMLIAHAHCFGFHCLLCFDCCANLITKHYYLFQLDELRFTNCSVLLYTCTYTDKCNSSVLMPCFFFCSVLCTVSISSIVSSSVHCVPEFTHNRVIINHN